MESTRFRTWIILGLSLLFPLTLTAQAATLRVTVSDSATSRPLIGATVEIRRVGGGIAQSIPTNRRGKAEARLLDGGEFYVVARLVGYLPRSVAVTVKEGEALAIAIPIPRGAVILDPLIVIANRTEELLLDVPVAISIVSTERLEQQTALTTIEYLANLPESQVLSSGLMTRRYTTRGPNLTSASTVRTMTDFRYTTMPGLELNADYLVSTTVEDIARAELLRGQATVQYGPNASRGVLNLITRSPLDDRGTSLRVAGGSQSTVQVTGRHASAVSDNVGFKVSGEYFEGEDRLPSSFAPDTAIGSSRLNSAQRIRADARVDWRSDSRTQTTFSGGLAQASTFDAVTYGGLGLYIDNGRMWYLQGRTRRGELRANVFLNKLDMDNMINIHTGRVLKDFSYEVRGQLQHASRLGSNTSLLYGADAGYTSGNSDSTVYGAWEGQAELSEVGGFVTANTRLGSVFHLVLSGRADYHSIIGNSAFAPAASIIYRPGPTHALRIGASRSYRTPGVIVTYQDIVGGPLGPFPYRFRSSGQPRTFRRDCGGLCMRSPYNSANAGGASQWLPADATTQWDAAVALLQDRGIDLSGVPAPDGTQVSSTLATASRGTFLPTASSDVVDWGGFERVWTNQFEVGYKALIDNRVRVGVDAYYKDRSHTGTRLSVQTPNVFFDRASAEAYLSQYMTAGQADSAAQALAGIPMGTVSFEEATHPTDLVTGQFLVPGGLNYWGASLDLEVAIIPGLSARANYTYLSKNETETERGRGVFNAPQNQGVLGVDYVNPRFGFNATLQGRFVEGYPAVNGITIIDLPSYTLIDAIAGYRIPGSNVSLSFTIYNVLDDVHNELPFTAEVGRLVIAGARAVF